MTWTTTRRAGTPTSTRRATASYGQSGPLVDEWLRLVQLARVLPADIGTSPRLCYHLLVGHAFPDVVCWPARSRLADEMNESAATAWRACRTLTEHGLIIVTPGSGRTSSMFRFVDFMLSTPVAPARPLAESRGRASAIKGSRQRDLGVAPARPEVIHEVIHEDAPIDLGGMSARQWAAAQVRR